MEYLIGDVAKKMNINSSTIRFYDKEGLMPFVQRDAAGRRKFKQQDMNFLEVIDCLKKSGVPVKDIAHFVRLCMEGDGTLQERYDYLDQEEKNLQGKIDELNDKLDFLRFKKWYYKTSVEAGTEKIHFVPGQNLVDPKTKSQYQAQLAKTDNLRDLIDLKKKA